MKHWRKFRLACACGEVLELEGSKEPEAGNETCRYLGFEMHGGAWKCWRCLGKPAPQGVIDLPHIREIGELGWEGKGAKIDALEHFRRITGDKQGGQDAPRD